MYIAVIQALIEKKSISNTGCNEFTIMNQQGNISLKKMGKKSKAGIWGPHELSDDQNKRVSICKMLISKQKKMTTSLIVS